MKILNFGSCNIDYVYSLDHIVSPGETISTKKMELFPGGKGLNQSVALARAGAQVYHAGVIGSDAQLLSDVLQSSGVDTTYLKQTDSKNGHAIIQVDQNGENSIFVHSGTNGMITPDFVDEVISHFEKGDILLLQNEINNVQYIIEKAYQKGLKIFFNPSPFTAELKNINLNHIYCLVVNEIEAKQMSGASDDVISVLKKDYPALKVVVTLGKRGCMYSDGSNLYRQNAFMVKAVDTTAAGDTFTGFFAALCAKGESGETAIKYACAASAISVSREGAAPSIPYMAEVEKEIATLKVNDLGKKTKQEKQCEQIINYINDNLADASIEGLSKIMGYSKAYAGILVKSLTGKTFSELLQTERCKKAAELLTNTDLSVGEIITRTGYENESFFRKKFSGIYNMSPLKYRKNGGIKQ